MGNIKKKHNETCCKCLKFKEYYAKGMCRSCYNRDWESKHPNWMKEYWKKYRKTHKEELVERHKAWYQKNKEKYKNRHLTDLGNVRQNIEILEFIRKKREGKKVKQYKALPIKAFTRNNERT